MAAIFGPSGCGDEFYNAGHKSLLEVPDFIENYGLDAFEYSFGHGYQMSTALAEKAGKLFNEKNIKLSLHAPFYINFANPDEVMYQKSQNYLRTGIKFLRAFGADRLVFHAASCGKAAREEALKLTRQRIKETMDMFEKEGLLEGIVLCPETMGKSMQIGTYKEVVDLCTLSPNLVPTFDFGHINALGQGCLKDKDDFLKVLDYSIEKLGFEKTNNAHVHFSKIQYGEKGEIRHLNFDDQIYGPEFLPFAEAMLERGLSLRIICESMTDMPKDALTMKNMYENLRKK